MKTDEIQTLLSAARIVPVVTIRRADDAVPLAAALARGGIRIIEITLRTPAALEAIEAVAREVPDITTAVGTVMSAGDMQRAADAGAVLAFSPGISAELLASDTLPLVAGVATASELMLGVNAGRRAFKFFPAGAAGGQAMLESLGGPFPDCRFCPTGGVSGANAATWLALSNVMCVGGSWLTPGAEVAAQDWSAIERRASEALAALDGRVSA
ncbi:MAG: bifunctional 4-hydroxy-2-oxoglutarate aldolase/2-dehydro-3-deoxy-phosphogluconate aldolase [Gammaproteobacteria bacterium]|nr:bifunctional 4-hydroxy-2-oxoglutarate aldolase/2-dehydro-3-deoxy-phosphogluconate aldolase [Gammaproteobacteria bacterium]NNM00975.1 bifunctional 4-hydroxy-2-oxoglutarate aldolase/2-dehydro-3-deoxy-phosphogluconate aldolase [Gammaproteobacteria bacterium]